MKRFLLSIVAVLLMSCSPEARAQSEFTGPSTMTVESAEALMMIHLSAWNLACQAKKANCNAFVMPYVGYTFLPGRYGQYLVGEKVVLVDIRLVTQPMSLLVMVHEMIHYLQWATGQRTPGDACAIEEEAFTLTWEVNQRLKLVDPNIERRLMTWEKALPNYPHCVMSERKRAL